MVVGGNSEEAKITLVRWYHLKDGMEGFKTEEVMVESNMKLRRVGSLPGAVVAAPNKPFYYH